MLCMPACPRATGFGYATVFTAYECLAFHHRILTCQPALARLASKTLLPRDTSEVEAIELGLCMPGLGQGHNQKKDTHTLHFDVTLAFCLTDLESMRYVVPDEERALSLIHI